MVMTSDLSRLLELFDSGALTRPQAGQPNTVDLARALAVIAGAPRFEAEAGAERMASVIGEPDHLVFVLADGLGMNLVRRLPADAFLRRHLALEIDAVFPSSTAPALTSLATGLWPSAHAVPTWFTYLSRQGITAVVLPYADRKTGLDLSGQRVDARYVFPLPAQAQYFRRDFLSFQPVRIARTVYTRYVTSGPGGEGYDSLERAIDGIAGRVRAARSKTYTYLYFPDIDSCEHEDGVESRSAWAQVLRLEREITRLSEMAGRACRVVLSADHGQITVPDAEKRLLDDRDDLRPMLRVWPPAGEPRMISFHVRAGQGQRFAEAFRARFADAFILLTADEAEELQLFGPGIFSPMARDRVGDFIAIPTRDQAIRYAREPGIAALKGMHGGLSPGEMRIPLVVG